jgi:hypothetical protein
VRDIPPSPHEKRLLRNLVKFLDDPARRVKRQRIIGWTGTTLAFVCIVVATLFADGRGDPFLWLVLAALGGFLAGLSVVFRAAARNWPILQRYFDRERLRADYEKMQG